MEVGPAFRVPGVVLCYDTSPFFGSQWAFRNGNMAIGPKGEPVVQDVTGRTGIQIRPGFIDIVKKYNDELAIRFKIKDFVKFCQQWPKIQEQCKATGGTFDRPFQKTFGTGHLEVKSVNAFGKIFPKLKWLPNLCKETGGDPDYPYGNKLPGVCMTNVEINFTSKEELVKIIDVYTQLQSRGWSYEDRVVNPELGNGNPKKIQNTEVSGGRGNSFNASNQRGGGGGYNGGNRGGGAMPAISFQQASCPIQDTSETNMELQTMMAEAEEGEKEWAEHGEEIAEMTDAMDPRGKINPAAAGLINAVKEGKLVAPRPTPAKGKKLTVRGKIDKLKDISSQEDQPAASVKSTPAKKRKGGVQYISDTDEEMSDKENSTLEDRKRLSCNLPRGKRVKKDGVMTDMQYAKQGKRTVMVPYMTPEEVAKYQAEVNIEEDSDTGLGDMDIGEGEANGEKKKNNISL